METLAKPLRKQLEDAVIAARDIAEEAARATLMHLGVGDADLPKHLTDEERALRRRLRAHGRQLGDHRRPDGLQAIDKLVQETAYEHWHRMLFARFLAENSLLMHPDGVPLTLAECDELAHDEGAADGWELAGRYASRMLPQIFRPDSPVLALKLAPEHQRALENRLAGLHPDCFQASDSLGWVYQFWQTKKKDQVNASEVKIGADELPAVTQLFTEPYMVAFLLDNSLGAWWAARRLSADDLRTAETEDALRHKAAIPGVPLEYLRFVRPPTATSASTVARASSPGSTVVRASSPDSPGQDGLATVLARAQGLDESTLKITHGENLPHWTCDNALYHVVFRLADSIPKAKLQAWAAERDTQAQAAERDGRQPTDAARRQITNQYRERIETYLDAGHGACHLAKPELAEIVANALKHFDDQRYRLHAWCVMPNHVHVIVEPLPGHDLPKIIHSWKSFTANTINKHLNRTGALWQEDAYNHIIRNEKEYDFQIRYVWHNPDKASIPDWPWRHAATVTVARAPTVARASSPGTILNAPNPDSPGQDGLATDPGQDGLATVLAIEKDWTPAAGSFDAWPEHLGKLKVMDPCCGSGHFLVAAFQMLVPMRMTLEGLSAQESVDAVLRDNLHGLELDQRCVEIAAFALALTAWRWPDAGGYRPLPTLNLACSGLGINAPKTDWLRLAEGNADLGHALERLYDLFADAPTLGSLIDPHRVFSGDLLDQGWDRVAPLLERALASEDDQQRELGVVAEGLARSAQMLSKSYSWVITNVPYRASLDLTAVLRAYIDRYYGPGSTNLASAFLLRCLEFLAPTGVTNLVLPQDWLVQPTYKEFRRILASHSRIDYLVRLGPGAFEEITGEVVNVLLLGIGSSGAAGDHRYVALDCGRGNNYDDKLNILRVESFSEILQAKIIRNPGFTVFLFDQTEGTGFLGEYASSVQGIKSGDDARLTRLFWECSISGSRWIPMQGTVEKTTLFGGLERVVDWSGAGELLARKQGLKAWGKQGVAISQMSDLPCALYAGAAFDSNVTVIFTERAEDTLALLNYAFSGALSRSVREFDQSIKPTNSSFEKIQFLRMTGLHQGLFKTEQEPLALIRTILRNRSSTATPAAR